MEGEGGAARSCPTPWPRPSQVKTEVGLVPCDGEWLRGGRCCGWEAGVGERSRAYSLASGPCLRSQCFSKACGFTTCPQWLHTTRKKSSWPGYRPKMDMSGNKKRTAQLQHHRNNVSLSDSRSRGMVPPSARLQASKYKKPSVAGESHHL